MTDIITEWEKVRDFFSKEYSEDMDLQGILFMIGVRELGKGFQKFNKTQKLDVMHVAICTLLEPYGFYEFEGQDKDGWPHWKPTEKLPHLKSGQQAVLIKEAIIDYLKRDGIIS